MGLFDFLTNFFQKPTQSPSTSPTSSKGETFPSVPKDTNIAPKETPAPSIPTFEGEKQTQIIEPLPEEIDRQLTSSLNLYFSDRSSPTFTPPPIPSAPATPKEKQEEISPDLKKAYKELDKLPDDFTVGDLVNFLDASSSLVTKGVTAGAGLIGKLGFWTGEAVIRALLKIALTSAKRTAQLMYEKEFEKMGIKDFTLEISTLPAKKFFESLGWVNFANLINPHPIKDIPTEIREKIPELERWGIKLMQSGIGPLEGWGWFMYNHPALSSTVIVGASLGLDLSPLMGGGKKQLFKSLANTNDTRLIVKLLTKSGVPEVVALKHADSIANTKNIRQIQKIMINVMEDVKKFRAAPLYKLAIQAKDLPDLVNLIHASGKEEEIMNMVKLLGYRNIDEFYLKTIKSAKPFITKIEIPSAKEVPKVVSIAKEGIEKTVEKGKVPEIVRPGEALEEAVKKAEIPQIVRSTKAVQEVIKEGEIPKIFRPTEAVEEVVKEGKVPKVVLPGKAVEETVKKIEMPPPGGFMSDDIWWPEWLKRASKKGVIEESLKEFKIPPPGGGISGGKPPPTGHFSFPEFGEDDIKKAFGKLGEGLKQLKPQKLWKGIEKEYSRVRGKKVVRFKKILEQEKSPVEALEKGIGSLKGSMQTEKVMKLKSVPSLGLTEADMQLIAEGIRSGPFDPWTIVRSWRAIKKLGLEKTLPPLSELRSLERVLNYWLGEKKTEFIINNLMSKVPQTLKEKILFYFQGLFNAVAKTIAATADMSAVFRQGEFYTWGMATKAWKTFWEVNKAILAEARGKPFFKKMMEQIRKDKFYNLAREFGVEFLEPDMVLGVRDEVFATKFIESIPGIGKQVGKVVRLSEYHFSGFLNWAKLDFFKDGWDYLRKMGISPDTHPEYYAALGEAVNILTSRAKLGSLSRLGDLLNLFFFAPRFTLSNLQLINPFFYTRLPGPVRKWVLMKVLKATAFRWGFKGLIAAWAASNFAPEVLRVELNPKSSDFGKIIINDTIRINPDRGLDQLSVLLWRLITFQKKNLATGEIEPLVPEIDPVSKDEYSWLIRHAIGWANELARWTEKKLSPFGRLLVDFHRGRTFTREPLTVKNMIYDRYVPFLVQDIVDVLRSGALQPGYTLPISLLAGTASFLGFGVQAFEPKAKRRARSVGGTDISGLGTTAIAPTEEEIQRYLQNLDREMQNYLKDLNDVSSKWGNFMLPDFDEHLQSYNPKTGEFYVWPSEVLIDEIKNNPQDWFKQK